MSGGGAEQDKLKDEVAELSAICNLPGVQFLQKVGSGGSGTVYKAFQPTVGRFVAVKVIDSVDSPAQLNNEAKLSKLLDHESVCKIYSYGQTTDGGFYLIMEWVEGESLAQVLQREKFLDARLFIEVVEKILAAVRMAHGHGVVHRDLKPGNIMLCQPDGDDHLAVKIIDFGIARHSPGNNSQDDTKHTTSLCGSPLYMSPEQCRNERGDERSDIYSLGIIMYECITGTTPFAGNTPMELMYKHSNEPAPRFGALVDRESLRAFEPLVLRCLQKSPAERYQAVDQLQSAFGRAAECATTKPVGRTKVMTAVVAALIVAAFSVGLLLLLNPAKDSVVGPPNRAAIGLNPWTQYRRCEDSRLPREQRQSILRNLLEVPSKPQVRSLVLCRLIMFATSDEERSKLALSAAREIDALNEFDRESSKESYRFHEAADRLVLSGQNDDAKRLLESESRAEKRLPLLHAGKKFGIETCLRLISLYTLMGRSDLAAKVQSEAQALCEAHKEISQTRLYELLIEAELAAVQEYGRDYAAAKRHFIHACGVEVEPEESIGWLRVLLPAASFLCRHGETEQSERVFKEALASAQGIQNDELRGGKRILIGTWHAKTLLTAGQLNKVDVATLRRALDLIEKLALEPRLDAESLADLAETKAEYLLALGRTDEARTSLDLALKYYGKLPEVLRPTRSRLAWVRGGIEYGQGNSQSAASCFLEAIETSPSLEFSARDPLIHKQMNIAAKLPLTGVSDAQLSNLRKAVEVKPDGFPSDRI